MRPFLEPKQIAALLADYRGDWWICGGWAIDLFLDRETRSHKDVDVAIPRQQQLDMQRYLLARGWRLEQAVDGTLRPWQTESFLSPPIHTIWCRHSGHQPSFLEILFNEIDGHKFAFRRDRSITRPFTVATLAAACGLPILAPEIVLLYKANDAKQEGNAADFQRTWPMLSREQQDWLRQALLRLYREHVWLSAGPSSANRARDC